MDNKKYAGRALKHLSNALQADKQSYAISDVYKALNKLQIWFDERKLIPPALEIYWTDAYDLAEAVREISWAVYCNDHPNDANPPDDPNNSTWEAVAVNCAITILNNWLDVVTKSGSEKE